MTQNTVSNEINNQIRLAALHGAAVGVNNF